MKKFEDIKKSMPEEIKTPQILKEILETEADGVAERKINTFC